MAVPYLVRFPLIAAISPGLLIGLANFNPSNSILTSHRAPPFICAARYYSIKTHKVEHVLVVMLNFMPYATNGGPLVYARFATANFWKHREVWDRSSPSSIISASN